MNRSELIDALANKANISRTSAANYFEIIQNEMMEALSRGEKVTITGFGTFNVKHRAKRQGVNPRNPKEKITIEAKNGVNFKPGKLLRQAINE